MVKVKPSWICQNCEQAFTTKYSLCRHFKRFPTHAPANLLDGSDLKPVTVTIDENVRTVQGSITIGGPILPSSRAVTVATTPYHDHDDDDEYHPHGTRQKGKGKRGSSSSRQGGLAKSAKYNSTTAESYRAVPVSAEPHSRHVVGGGETPLHHQNDYDEAYTPSTAATSTTAVFVDVTTTGTSTAFQPVNSSGFPFLPSYLEEDQILDIATPQQQHSHHHDHQSSSASSSPPPSSSSTREALSSPMAAHYSWMFTKETTAAGPGGDLLSPLAPACNYGQVFSEEAEANLQQHVGRKQQQEPSSTSTPATMQQHPGAQQQQEYHHHHHQVRSPVELSVLDQSLLLGDEEATMSPFTFLEKTSGSGFSTVGGNSRSGSGGVDGTSSTSDPTILTPRGTSLQFLSPAKSRSGSSSAYVSLEDLDFGFAF